ncbi:MAG: cob(I)yrinic acid a,c-diamide adenosyltransferase [Verrucomicrobiota bacterium]
MPITTKRGDNGETDLMYGKRVPKTHQRIAAYGAIDELTSALGVARCAGLAGKPEKMVTDIQRQLIVVMGELALMPEDAARYEKDGHRQVDDAMVETLTEISKRLEEDNDLTFSGWAIPGDDGPLAAQLDLARVICRRAEREVWALIESGEIENQRIANFLNRISDIIWLLARAESKDA